MEYTITGFGQKGSDKYFRKMNWLGDGDKFWMGGHWVDTVDTEGKFSGNGISGRTFLYVYLPYPI